MLPNIEFHQIAYIFLGGLYLLVVLRSFGRQGVVHYAVFTCHDYKIWIIVPIGWLCWPSIVKLAKSRPIDFSRFEQHCVGCIRTTKKVDILIFDNGSHVKCSLDPVVLPLHPANPLAEVSCPECKKSIYVAKVNVNEKDCDMYTCLQCQIKWRRSRRLMVNFNSNDG